jgi:uncharacterized membrane protein YesL
LNWTDQTVAQLVKRQNVDRPALLTRRRDATPRVTPARVMEWFKWPQNLALINVAVLVASLGVVTWFAATTAGYRSLRQLAIQGDDRIWRNFWSALRNDLPRRLAVGAVLTAGLAVVLANLYFLHRQNDSIAAPLYTLNLLFLGVWALTTAAAVRICADGAPETARRTLLAAALDAIAVRGRHLIVLAGMLLSLTVAAVLPLVGLFFSVSLMILTVVMTGSSTRPPLPTITPKEVDGV